MTPARRPIPSLARAASDMRAARMAVAERGAERDSHLRHRKGMVELRHALDVYVSALERDGLPVASKLRQELRLLAVIEDPRHRLNSIWPPGQPDR
jgi:hypothetical protein